MGDKEWQEWQSASDRFAQLYSNNQLRNIMKNEEYVEQMNKGSYQLFLLTSKFDHNETTEEQKYFCDSLGLDIKQIPKSGSIVVKDGDIIYPSEISKKEYYLDDSGVDLLVKDNLLYTESKVYGLNNKMTVVIYDTKTHGVADVITWKKGKINHISIE